MQLVDTAQKNGHGDRVWIDSTGINAAGYATTVWMDDDNTQAEELQYGTAIPDLMAAGTDGTNMIIAQLGTFNSGSGNYPQPDPNFAPDHVGEFPGRGILVVPTAGASTVATSISEFDDRGEQYIIGGTTYYGCGSGQTSDFTLLKIDDSGDVDTSFGNNPMTVAGENYNQYTLNFGNTRTANASPSPTMPASARWCGSTPRPTPPIGCITSMRLGPVTSTGGISLPMPRCSFMTM